MDVLRMVLGQSLSVVIIGVILGLAGSLGVTRLMTTMLFNVSAGDPATFALVCVSLLAIVVAASLIPALRATLVDPAHTLRRE